VRPRLRQGAYVAAARDGALWLSDSGPLLLKGGSVAAVAERLAPHLHGQQTIEQLTAALSSRHRDMVVELIRVLVDAGLVTDADGASPASAPAGDVGPDRGCAEYLAGESATYERYAERRALLIGTGRLVTECADALRRSGVVDVVALEEGGVLTGNELESAGSVVQVFPADEVESACRVADRCAARGVPLVQALASGSGALIGPVTGVRWTSVWRRLDAVERERFLSSAAELPAASSRILADQLVFRSFRHLIGAPLPDADRVTVFDAATLAVTHRRVLPHPDGSPATPASRAQFLRSVELLRDGGKIAPERFSTAVMSCIDELFGPIRDIGDGDTPQLPLRRARAVVAGPASAATSSVTAAGPDFAAARHRTAVEALRLYCSLTMDPRRLQAGQTWGLRLHDDEPCRVEAAQVFPLLHGRPATAGLAAGSDWAEMVTAGVLDHCAARALARSGSLPVCALDWPALGSDPELARHRRLLAVLGHDVDAFDLTAALSPVPTVAFVIDGDVVGVVSRLRLVDAAREGLEELLAGAQSGAAPTGLRGMPEHWAAAPQGRVDPDATVPLDAAVEALRRDGSSPVLVPLDHDPAIAQVLPYVGMVVLGHE
jgi:hypothetical protein